MKIIMKHKKKYVIRKSEHCVAENIKNYTGANDKSSNLRKASV